MQQTIKVHFWSEKNDVSNNIQDMRPATENSAAVDIRCVEDFSIKPNENKMIRTGLFVSIPNGYCMKVYPRSGISAKTDLIFKNTTGIIDSDYRGREIFVMWYNLGIDDVKFKKGDRVAQAIIDKIISVEYVTVDSIDHLKAMGNDRGGGIGSTGLI
jgi:dUTP pyrophosphatase